MVIGTTDPVKNKILVVSSTPSSLSLIKQIVGKEDLTFRSIYSDEIQSADWTIDNKYYTAEVEFWHLNELQYPPTQLPINEEQLGELCEALILVFDSTKPETFEKLHPWAKFVEEFNPSVLLCIGMGKCENRRVFNEWCVDNGLELVEVIDSTQNTIPANTNAEQRPEENKPEEDEEEDDPFGSEAEGKERIIEALGSTMWENMKQKERRGMDRLEEQLNMLALGAEEAGEASAATGPTFDPLNFDEDLHLARGGFQHSTAEISQNLLALQSFLRETEQEEGEEIEKEGEEAQMPAFGTADTALNVEHFESALAGLRKLRENAQQLPDSQRKALAAQVISMLFPEEEWD